MTLINQDLLSLSKSISDTLSRPEILIDDYIEKYAWKFLVNSYEFYNDKDEAFLEQNDWDKSVYYFGPD